MNGRLPGGTIVERHRCTNQLQDAASLVDAHRAPEPRAGSPKDARKARIEVMAEAMLATAMGRHVRRRRHDLPRGAPRIERVVTDLAWRGRVEGLSHMVGTAAPVRDRCAAKPWSRIADAPPVADWMPSLPFLASLDELDSLNAAGCCRASGRTWLRRRHEPDGSDSTGGRNLRAEDFGERGRCHPAGGAAGDDDDTADSRFGHAMALHERTDDHDSRSAAVGKIRVAAADSACLRRPVLRVDGERSPRRRDSRTAALCCCAGQNFAPISSLTVRGTNWMSPSRFRLMKSSLNTPPPRSCRCSSRGSSRETR